MDELLAPDIKGKDLNEKISNALNGRNILDYQAQQLHTLRKISNKGVHYNTPPFLPTDKAVVANATFHIATFCGYFVQVINSRGTERLPSGPGENTTHTVLDSKSSECRKALAALGVNSLLQPVLKNLILEGKYPTKNELLALQEALPGTNVLVQIESERLRVLHKSPVLRKETLEKS